MESLDISAREQAAPILLERPWRVWNTAAMTPRASASRRTSVLHDGKMRKDGLTNLEENNGAWRDSCPARLGIGHTRWATHGEPNDINSHPHLSQNGKIALVHNGIIENYLEIAAPSLQAKGVKFVSRDRQRGRGAAARILPRPARRRTRVPDAIYMVLHRIEGAYAFGIVCADEPGPALCRAQGRTAAARLRRGLRISLPPT